MVAQEGAHGRDMRVGDVALQLIERPFGLGRIGDDRAQSGGDFGRIGIGRPGADARDGFAVALQRRDVDPVHRGAADDPDGEAHAMLTFSAPTPSMAQSSRSPG